MNRLSIALLSILTSIILLLSSACEEKVPKLNRSHRKLVDSLVQQQRTLLREELDSLCDIRFEAEIQQKTDSIVKERMAEIQRKIEADAKKN